MAAVYEAERRREKRKVYRVKGSARRCLPAVRCGVQESGVSLSATPERFGDPVSCDAHQGIWLSDTLRFLIFNI